MIIELYLNDLPLTEVSDLITTVLTREPQDPREPRERSLASGLFDEMTHSRITAAVSSQIVLRDTIDTTITVQDLQITQSGLRSSSGTA